MLKRTKGRLLLTLLVITGLAGTLNDSSISHSERKSVISQLKNSKAEILNSVKGLSDAQLNYKKSADIWSIKECLYHIALTENGLWEIFKTSMQAPVMPEKRKKINVSDDEIISVASYRQQRTTDPELFKPGHAQWKNLAEALAAFKTGRSVHLKYVRNTTEDLRNHVIDLPGGAVDGYQLILMIAGNSNHYVQHINDIKADPGFPQ